MDEDDRKKVPKMHDLYVDIGVSSKEEALTLVAFGDAGVFLQPYIELANERPSRWLSTTRWAPGL
jgi:putative aminopeptidase FrvX